MKKFKVGDNAVHLSHGLGVIKSIEKREFSGKVQEFYILEVQDNGAPKKVFIPLEVASTRLRHLVTRAEAEKILAYIVSGKDVYNYSANGSDSTWNRRYRDYMERIHSGNLKDIAEVYVSIKRLREAADLSFGERKLLEQAETLISKELDAVGLTLPQ